MGHLHIRNMHRTKKWFQVVNLLETGSNTAVIAAKAIDASQSGIKKATNDASLVYTF